MTALDDTLGLMDVRHAAVIGAYDLDNRLPEKQALAREALERLGLDPAAAALADASVLPARLALDVVVWAWVEGQAALAYDFSADGGSYQRSQLAANAARLRRLAEDRAAAAGLTGFGWPVVEVIRFVDEGGYCVSI